VVATLLSLVVAGFCLFMANLITYGLAVLMDRAEAGSGCHPAAGRDRARAATGSPGDGVGPRRAFWLRSALIVSPGGIVLASVMTWVPVALDR